MKGPRFAFLLPSTRANLSQLHPTFPNPQIGVPFPKNFLSVDKTILKRLFRVYAHMYHSHFNRVVDLGEEPHLNTSFKHFIYFVQVRQSSSFPPVRCHRPCSLSIFFCHEGPLTSPFFNRSSTSLMCASSCRCRSSLSGSSRKTSERTKRQPLPPASNRDACFAPIVK